MIRYSLFALLLASLTVACGKKDEDKGDKKEATQTKGDDKTKTAPSGELTIEGMNAIVDKMCACEDKACFEKVEKEAEKAYPGDVAEKVMKENPEEAEKIMKKLMDCAMKLEEKTAGDDADKAPAEAPPAEAGDAPAPAPGGADAGA